MYVPSMGFDVNGHEEVKEVIFGWLNDIEAKQELVNIIEFKNTVTTFLHIVLIIYFSQDNPLSREID